MYVITSRSDARIGVRVSGDKAHALTVVDQLMEYSGFPSDLELHEEGDPPAPPAVTRWGKFNRWLSEG